jgi:hypothetical protein
MYKPVVIQLTIVSKIIILYQTARIFFFSIFTFAAFLIINDRVVTSMNSVRFFPSSIKDADIDCCTSVFLSLSASNKPITRSFFK